MFAERVPQKSTVNTSKLNTKSMATMNEQMGTSLHTMTMALRKLASSTPRFTSSTMSQLTQDISTSPGTSSCPESVGTK